eukprot:339786-Pelagomonas_calceolata.AAC.4
MRLTIAQQHSAADMVCKPVYRPAASLPCVRPARPKKGRKSDPNDLYTQIYRYTCGYKLYPSHFSPTTPDECLHVVSYCLGL